MANISAYGGKQMLDWVLGGAGATAPAGGRWLGLAWGTPNSTGGSDINVTMGCSRMTASFMAANSPAGSASNPVAVTFGPFSSAASVLGINIYDSSNVAGNQWMFGTLQTARTVGIGDSLVVAIGALTITLS